MKLSQWATLITIAIVAVVALSYFTKDQPAAITSIQKTSDSLAIARDTLDATLSRSAIERDERNAAILASERRASDFRRRADDQKRRADSLVVLAKASDSTSGQWMHAYFARDTEAAQLRGQVVELTAQKDALVRDTVRLSKDLALTITYTQRVEQFNAELKRELAKKTDCTIVGPIPCPSRTVVALTSLAAGFVIARR